MTGILTQTNFWPKWSVYLPSCAACRAYHRTCPAGRGWSIRCRTAQLFVYYPQPWVANFPIWVKRPFPLTDLIQPLYLQLLLRSLHFLAGWWRYTCKIMPHFISYYVYVVDMCQSKWRWYRNARLWQKKCFLEITNPFYLTLFSPWLLLTTLCCHWIFSNIIIFHLSR